MGGDFRKEICTYFWLDISEEDIHGLVSKADGHES